MMTKIAATAAAVLLTFGGLTVARAEQIELANGRVLHGEILGGQTTDDGLAVKVFATGGTVMVRWDHVLESRRRQLRLDYGIDIEEEEQVYVDGHQLTLVTGEKVRGLLMNPLDRSGPARIKTTRGEREYPRDRIAKTESIEIESNLVFTPREAYQRQYDAAPPEMAADHFALAIFSIRVEDFEKAREHFQAADRDPDFRETPEGLSLKKRMDQVDVLIAAAGAREMVQKINLEKSRNNWNGARDLFLELKQTFQGQENILKAVRSESLEKQIVRGRDKYFMAEVPRRVYRVMDKLLLDKAREKKPRSLGEDDDNSTQGTINGARQWCGKELPTALWAKVAEDLGLQKEEVDRYWLEGKRVIQRATYGTGSFIVIQKAQPKKDEDRRRRAPGSDRNRGRRDDKGAPAKKKKEEKAKTEQEWWDFVNAGDKKRWMEAHFVESSGIFDVIRVDDSEACSGCGGLGFTTAQTSDGGSESHFCVQCNGSGKFRKVIYR